MINLFFYFLFNLSVPLMTVTILKRAQKKQEQSVDDKLKQLSLNSSPNGINITNPTQFNSNPALNSTNATSSLTGTSTNTSIVSEMSASNGVLSPDSLGFTLVSENEGSTKTKKHATITKTETETVVTNGANLNSNGLVDPNAVDSASALVPAAKSNATDADAEDEDDDDEEST